MDQKPKLTLDDIRQSDKLKEGQSYKASDFLSEAEQEQIAKARAKGKQDKRKFDEIDAYTAEIVARFGYEFYKEWNAGLLPDEKVAKMILAERAREKQQLLSLEGIIIAMVSPTIQRQKGKPAPKSPKVALRIFKEDARVARGE